jgi:hypothetical protein
MALVGKLTPDYKLKLKGSLTTGYDGISFDKDGNLSCLEVHTQEPGLDDTEMIDDTYQLDDTHEFDDTLGIENFLEYLFNLTTTDVDINYFSIDGKKILLNEILENQTL